MRFIIRFITLICLSTSLLAQDRLVPQMDNPIHGNQYIIDYDEFNKIPKMVYYIVTENKLGDYGRYSFHNELYPKSARSDWYMYTDYDRGHMMSSKSSDSDTSNYESFDMINILPQLKSFNTGLWKQTEVFERNNCEGICHVVCGVVYIGDEEYINGMMIPKVFYKAIYNPIYSQMIGFIMSQTDRGNLMDYTVPIDSIELLLNQDLFEQLDDYIENKLEAELNKNRWN